MLIPRIFGLGPRIFGLGPPRYSSKNSWLRAQRAQYPVMKEKADIPLNIRGPRPQIRGSRPKICGPRPKAKNSWTKAKNSWTNAQNSQTKAGPKAKTAILQQNSAVLLVWLWPALFCLALGPALDHELLALGGPGERGQNSLEPGRPSKFK